MAYNIDRMPDEPITIWEFSADWDWGNAEKANAILRNMWDEIGYPAYHIVLITLPDEALTLEELQIGFGDAAYGPNALFAHPNLKLSILVSENGMVKLAVKNIQEIEQDGVYRRVSMTSAPTLDDALAIIRKDNAAG